MGRKNEDNQCPNSYLVPQEGLEPPHPCEYQILSLARLPVPPLGPTGLDLSLRPPGRASRANAKPDGDVARRCKGTQGAWAPLPCTLLPACGRSAGPSAARG